MQIQTAELEGENLNRVVARIEGLVEHCDHGFAYLEYPTTPATFSVMLPCYANDDRLTGAIIDRERITTHAYNHGTGWYATLGYFCQEGPTRKIAALRCFVASRLGDEVEIPK